MEKIRRYFFEICAIALCLLCVGLAKPAKAATIMALDTAGLAGNEATVNATTNDPNLQTVTLSRGSGINAVALANAYASTAFVVGGNKAAAVSNAECLQFTLEPKTAYRMSLSAINVNIRRSGTGPNAYQWQYSLDNFATAGVDVGAVGSYVGTEANGAAMPTVDLSGVSALQNVASGQKVTFRLYAWGATGAAGTFSVGRLAGDDLVVMGDVSLNKIAAFDPVGRNGDEVDFSATTLDALLESARLTRGSGIEPSFLLNAFSSRHFTLNGSKTDALAGGDYIQTSIRAKEFYRSQFNGINFNLRRSSTGPVAYQWQYSLDGFATAGTDLGAQGSYVGLDDDGSPMPAIDASGVANLQKAKEATFRLYAWGATSTAGTLAFARRSGDDLSFTGRMLPNKIVAFDPIANNGDEASFAATTLDAGVVTSTLVRGAGIDPSFLLRAFSANNFTVGGNKAQAVAANEYFQYAVAPKTGYHLKLKYLDANLRRSGTGPNAYQWQYSLDGFATAGTDLGGQVSYTGTEDAGAAAPQIDLSAYPALANVPTGQTVTLRLYAWGATGAPGSFAIGRLDGDDLAITGEAYLNTYALAYSSGPNGSVSGSSTQLVAHGSDGTAVTAVPDVGYHFVDWSDASTANPRTDLAVTGNLSVTANFAVNVYSLSYAAGPHGTLSGSSTQLVAHGSDGTAVTAVPDVGYHFVDWSDASTANPRTDLAVTGNLSVTANFTVNVYSLSYAAGPHGAVVGNLSQNVSHGLDGTVITAMPDQGYVFVDWSDGSTMNSRVDRNVTGNVNVVANFQPITPTGGGAFFPPAGIGTGKYDTTVAMQATRDIGNVDEAGVNLLAFIGSTARFFLPSGKAVSLSVTDVDLYRNRIAFQGASGASGAVLDLDQSVNWDVDGDGVADMRIVFAGVYINRVELTLKALRAENVRADNDRVAESKTTSVTPAKTSKAPFNRDLKSGMTGADVKLLQVWLNRNGFVLTRTGPGSPGHETEKFGAYTRQAVAGFQRASGIKPAYGYFGPLTREAVNKRY